jgi:hypothetical protein
MLVWILLIAYCAWCVIAPKAVLRTRERMMGSPSRIGPSWVRGSGLLFLLFLIGLYFGTRP